MRAIRNSSAPRTTHRHRTQKIDESMYSQSFTEELEKVFSEAREISNLYAELINGNANVYLPLGAIIAALACPAEIGQDRACTKDQLMEAVRAYAEVCADYTPKFKIRNYNFFREGHYLNYINQDADGSDRGWPHGMEA